MPEKAKATAVMAEIGPAKAGNTRPERARTSGRSQRKRRNWTPVPVGDVGWSNRTDRRAQADEVVLRGLDHDGGRCTAYPGADLPCCEGGRQRAGGKPAKVARPLPVREAAGDPTGDPAERGPRRRRRLDPATLKPHTNFHWWPSHHAELITRSWYHEPSRPDHVRPEAARPSGAGTRAHRADASSASGHLT